MHKIVFFVPEPHAEAVKQAAFRAGAGRFRNYDSCSWQTLGSGQFRPLSGSDPFLGSEGVLERVPEVRVEMICADEDVAAAIRAVVDAHPYEEPAYEAYRIVTLDEFESGR